MFLHKLSQHTVYLTPFPIGSINTRILFLTNKHIVVIGLTRSSIYKVVFLRARCCHYNSYTIRFIHVHFFSHKRVESVMGALNHWIMFIFAVCQFFEKRKNTKLQFFNNMMWTVCWKWIDFKERPHEHES